MSLPPVEPPHASPAAPPGGADPSMEDILASIRRILSEDEQPPGTAAAAPGGQAPVEPPPAAKPPAVLTLSEDMLVSDPHPPAALPEPPPLPGMPEALAELAAIHPTMHPDPEPPAPARFMEPPDYSPPPPPPEPPNGPAPHRSPLMAPQTEAAAASAVGSLLRALVQDREQVQVYRGGPTIEDLVREEIRPLLKTWLDANLPPVVERLVRAEIERVVGRAVS